MTFQGALRWDNPWSWFPEQTIPQSRFFPGASFDKADGVTGYNDIAPRMGLAYDVFGDGKTAVKVNLSKYFQATANDGVYINANKASTFAQTSNRAWADGNKNFVPDCNLSSPLLQDNTAAGGDLCGPAGWIPDRHLHHRSRRRRSEHAFPGVLRDDNRWRRMDARRQRGRQRVFQGDHLLHVLR